MVISHKDLSSRSRRSQVGILKLLLKSSGKLTKENDQEKGSEKPCVQHVDRWQETSFGALLRDCERKAVEVPPRCVRSLEDVYKAEEEARAVPQDKEMTQETRVNDISPMMINYRIV